MLTYSGLIDKATFVAGMEAHRAANRLVQGQYWGPDQRGCAVGCGIQTINEKLGRNEWRGNERVLSTYLGWPLWFVYLQEEIFETLPKSAALDWPVKLAAAIPTGVELQPAARRITLRVLVEILKTKNCQTGWSYVKSAHDVIHCLIDAMIDRHFWRSSDYAWYPLIHNMVEVLHKPKLKEEDWTKLKQEVWAKIAEITLQEVSKCR
jgi:hypothetical protein